MASGERGINCADYGSNCLLYPRPAGRHQNHDSETSSAEILLVPKVRVGRNQKRESFALGRVEQLAVSQRRPAALVGGGDLVLLQGVAQRDRSSLIEEYAHLGWSQRAPCSVFQDGTNLLEGDAGEPLDEL